MTKGFNVYKNEQWVGFIHGRSLKAAKAWIKGNVWQTHMGSWRRDLGLLPEDPKQTAFHYEYATTIGAYYKFSPAQKAD